MRALTALLIALFTLSAQAEVKQVTVDFTPATQYEDGTLLTPADHKVYWSTTTGAACSGAYALTGSTVPTGFQTRQRAVVVADLIPGSTYYFAMTTLDANGAESVCSTEVAMTVPGTTAPTPRPSPPPAPASKPMAPTKLDVYLP